MADALQPWSELIGSARAKLGGPHGFRLVNVHATTDVDPQAAEVSLGAVRVEVALRHEQVGDSVIYSVLVRVPITDVDGLPHINVEVEYSALYERGRDQTAPSQDELSAFGALDAAPAIWPYTRALINHLTVMMGMSPGVVLPAVSPQQFWDTIQEADLPVGG